MSFFYTEVKKKPATRSTAPRGPVPIQSLNKLGCSVCPKDKDRDLVTPKMEPEGARSPLIYVLMPAPSRKDDSKGDWLTDSAGRAVRKALKGWDREVRYGGLIQCGSDNSNPGTHELECCRQRVVEDIEDAAPVVVIGVGGAAVSWATGLDAYAPKFRGSLMATKFGQHACWFYCVDYPSWAFAEHKYPSKHQLAFEHDMATLLDRVHNSTLPQLEHVGDGPYDQGIELVTGAEGRRDLARLEEVLGDLTTVRQTGVDIETNALRPWGKDPHIWTASVGTFESTVAFPLDHPDGWGSESLRRGAWGLLGEFLLYSNTKVAHNLAMELEWFAFFYGAGLLRRTHWDDTMSMCHTLDERPGTKSLDTQIRMAFGFHLKAQSRVDVKRPNWVNQYPIRDTLRYNGLDSKWTERLARTLRPRIGTETTLEAEHERKVRLAPTLVIMEALGLPTDLDYARDMEESLESRVKDLEKRIQATGEVRRYVSKFGPFQPTNTEHVLRLMDKVCQREEIERIVDDVPKKTVDEEALSSIPANEVPSAPLILEHRGVEKLLSTYVRPITTKRIVSHDQLIHSKYSSMVAVTGRLAGEDPNPQNWPKRKHKEIRGVVSVVYEEELSWILSADYGQIEFRVVGMASEDPNLVRACWTGYDVHKFWAERIVQVYPRVKDWVVSEFGVDWEEKGIKTLRQEAKNKWVFPMLFGSSHKSCAIQLHLPEDTAEKLSNEFWDEFPQVKRWQKKLMDKYRRDLYVETLGGRRRRGAMTLNEVVNLPIQGTAADIVCAGMDALSERAVLEDRMHLHPRLNVHDDLTFIIPDAVLEPSIDVIVQEMCMPRFDYINVPLVVEVSIGTRWSNQKEIGVYRSHEVFGTPNPYEQEKQ